MKQDQRAITTIRNTHGISFTAIKIKNECGLLYDALSDIVLVKMITISGNFAGKARLLQNIEKTNHLC